MEAAGDDVGVESLEAEVVAAFVSWDPELALVGTEDALESEADSESELDPEPESDDPVAAAPAARFTVVGHPLLTVATTMLAVVAVLPPRETNPVWMPFSSKDGI